MPTTVPLNFRVYPIPRNFKGDINALAQAIAARLTAESGSQISFFASGSTAPTSDVGPWWDGSKWWRWDTGTASYVAQEIGDASLGYIAQLAAPDQTIYTFWIELDGGGKAQSIKYYSGGAWKDVYEDKFATYSTTTAMNAAIAAAIASIPSSSTGQGAFSASPSVQQDVVFGGAGNQAGVIALGTENFDPDGAFASNTFTAPATGYYQFNWGIQITVTGTPTEADIMIRLAIAGVPTKDSNNIDGPYTKTGGIFVGSALVYLTSGQQVDLRYDFTVDAACTVAIQPGNGLNGYRVR